MLVPRSFAARMRKGDPEDPLLRQVLPDSLERETVHGYSQDPLEETRFVSDGVVRKYAGRALLIATGACPVHCRYCFRRHFPYAAQLASRHRWSRAVAALRREPDLTEVILSGGDPLTLTNEAMYAWAFHDGPGALRMIEGVDDPDTQTRLRRSLVDGWMRSDDKLGATEFIASFPDMKQIGRAHV